VAAWRDLKPANIFVLKSDDPRDPSAELVKVVDFGIATVADDHTDPGRPAPARLTVPGMVLGTAEYMSPEQAQGFKTDHRVDQYALGCIIYEMLTGRVPHEGVTPAATMLKHITDKPVPPSRVRPNSNISEALDQIVQIAMAVEPAARFPSMKELEQALSDQLDILRGRPPSSSAIVLPKKLNSLGVLHGPRRWLAVAAAGVLLLGGVGLGAALMRRPKPPAPAVAKVAEPVARVIKWDITSEPSGAVIMRRGDHTVLGQTPWKHSQDAGSGMMEVELRKQGFVPKRLQLDLGSDVSLQSKLSPESSAPDRKDRGKRGKPVRKKGSSIRDNNDVSVLH